MPHRAPSDPALGSAHRQPLFLIVIGSEHVITKFNEFKTKLSEHKANNPLDRFKKEKQQRRFVVQKNEFLPREARPDVRYKKKYSFFDEYEYTIVMSLTLTEE
ncbi:hypothetical protein LTS15_000944 [Exophiala xenobiotica]|nr:hypothetical protein LTS15_000944 [Exophiala xenobiotica]